MPLDPSMLVQGGEWNVGNLDGGTIKPGGSADGKFGGMLTEQLGKLGDLQNDAAKQSQALATGQASDPASVVMAVERARLGMQLASTIRTKAVESVQEIFRTQV